MTKIHGTKSGELNILGALLFILYINDMKRILKKCKIILYADDTLIYAKGEAEEEQC